MRQGMLTLSGAPSTTSHLDINILSILHYLGSPLDLCTYICDLMRNSYIHNVCTYILLLWCLWRIALLCWQIFVPEAIHNQVAIKLLVSGLLTGHICCVYLFLHHNRSYIYILIVPCKSFVILTSYWQRRVSCMRQGMLTLSGAPSTTSHLDINILSILHYLGSPLDLCT